VRRTKKLAVFFRRDVIDADVKRIDPHLVNGDLIAAVLRIHKPMMVTHFKLAGRDQREARQCFVLRQKSEDAERHDGGQRKQRFPETMSCLHSNGMNGIPPPISTDYLRQ